MSTLHEGDRINNYLLEARAGAGSFGEVWRARHHVFGDKVAIKVPTNSQYVRNLQREGVAVHGLRHPNIVAALDLDPYADPPYLIMEYVDGPSVRAAIDTYKQGFPIDAAVAVLRGVLHALDAAHAAGVIHRDIKPENILLSQPLDQLASIAPAAVKVTDFGLGYAGGLTKQAMVQSGSILAEQGHTISGTLAYMSPEQREGKDLDARSDLYSCGVVLFEMLTGERPAGSDSPSGLRPQVPAPLDEVFQRCHTRRDRRFPGARDVLAALDRMHSPAARAPRWAPNSVPRRCSACNTALEAEDQFCIGCGLQLSAAIPRCASCSAFVNIHDRFCILCGNDLSVLA